MSNADYTKLSVANSQLRNLRSTTAKQRIEIKELKSQLAEALKNEQSSASAYAEALKRNAVLAEALETVIKCGDAAYSDGSAKGHSYALGLAVGTARKALSGEPTKASGALAERDGE